MGGACQGERRSHPPQKKGGAVITDLRALAPALAKGGPTAEHTDAKRLQGCFPLLLLSMRAQRPELRMSAMISSDLPLALRGAGRGFVRVSPLAP